MAFELATDSVSTAYNSWRQCCFFFVEGRAAKVLPEIDITNASLGDKTPSGMSAYVRVIAETTQILKLENRIAFS